VPYAQLLICMHERSLKLIMVSRCRVSTRCWFLHTLYFTDLRAFTHWVMQLKNFSRLWNRSESQRKHQRVEAIDNASRRINALGDQCSFVAPLSDIASLIAVIGYKGNTALWCNKEEVKNIEKKHPVVRHCS